ncbi:MAG: hypothetical protein KME46_14945 [Brasilonema angustatum HA4187-MV1]|jgi:hypothetical protein|nr:hypothetical protein [Brasilonema angustatum HA4187-MV1]
MSFDSGDFEKMSFTIKSAHSIFGDTQVANAVPAIVESFNQLSIKEQLVLLWFIGEMLRKLR